MELCIAGCVVALWVNEPYHHRCWWSGQSSLGFDPSVLFVRVLSLWRPLRPLRATRAAAPKGGRVSGLATLLTSELPHWQGRAPPV